MQPPRARVLLLTRCRPPIPHLPRPLPLTFGDPMQTLKMLEKQLWTRVRGFLQAQSPGRILAASYKPQKGLPQGSSLCLSTVAAQLPALPLLQPILLPEASPMRAQYSFPHSWEQQTTARHVAVPPLSSSATPGQPTPSNRGGCSRR